MRLRSLLAAAALAASSLAARADSFTTFDLNSTFAGNDGNGTVTGTLVLDTTTSLFTTANLTASGFTSGNAVLQELLSQGDVASGEFTAIIDNSATSAALVLRLPVASLTAYSGSAIALDSAFSGGIPPFDLATSGSLTPEAAPPAVTPEPSSIALLGTGMLSLAGVVRKRYLSA